MPCSYTINISLPVDQNMVDSLYRVPSSVHSNLIRTQNLFKALVGGDVGGTAIVDVMSGTAAAVAAVGTVTITHANVAANDTVTFGTEVYTAKASGAVGKQFNIGADATADAVAFAAAINANSPYFTATAALGVVSVSMNVKGSVGNLVQYTTSKSSAFAFVQPTGGVGGPETAPVTMAR